MNPDPVAYVLGRRIDCLSKEEVLSKIQKSIEESRFLHLITVNSLMLLETEKDHELREIFDKAGLAIADSIGVEVLAGIKGFKRPERIPGIDLIRDLCGRARDKGWTIYFLGSKPGVAQETGARLKAAFPGLKVVGSSHGYFSGNLEKEVLEDIKMKRPQILFVALQVPYQEKWIYRNSPFFDGACVLGVGGSFDVLSGRLLRAPAWARSFGLEWLFRFIQEPWRWKRILRLPYFFLRALINGTFEKPPEIS